MKKNRITLVIFLITIFQSVGYMQQEITKNEVDNFFESIAATADQKQKIELSETFYTKLQSSPYPIFENDTTYILFYKGKNDSVGVLGDMNNWTDIIWMKKVEGTNLFYLKGNAPSDARIEYWLMFGKNSMWSLDPLNPFKSLNGFGELSELAMPAYKRHPYFNEFIYGKKGSEENLKVYEINSDYLGYKHTIHIYLPPGYNMETKYPVLYLQDGIDYVEFAQVPTTMDQLIHDNKIKPMMVVFVTPPNRFQPGIPNRMTEYGLNDNYVKFFAEELVPFIDKNYSTFIDPKARLVAGDSFGGLISAYIPFARPDVFANGYSQSGYQSFNNDKLITLYKTEPKKEIKLYVDIGIYEEVVGGSFLPKEELNFLEANRRLKKVLNEKGYNFVYKEYSEGHTWGNWKRHLIDALIYFFPKDEQ